jgi:DNA-directed RNA polymerase subunit RPC12/RpoP
VRAGVNGSVMFTLAVLPVPRFSPPSSGESGRPPTLPVRRTLRLMAAPLIYYKPCSIGDTYFRECLTCGAIVKNEGLHTLYHEQQASPKRCPKCGLLDIGRHVCPEAD